MRFHFFSAAAPASLMIPGGADVVRHDERRVFPAQRLARQRDFLGAQRLAVRRLGALLVRRAPADDGLAADQRRLVLARARLLDGGRTASRIVAVDVLHDVPAVRLEALRRVVVEPLDHLAVDRDAVVVVEHDELAELEGAGQRTGFVRDAFHEAAVADEAVGVVIDDRQAFAVELAGQQFFGQRHADRVGQALAQRTRWWSRCRCPDRARDDPRCASPAGGNS